MDLKTILNRIDASLNEQKKALEEKMLKEALDSFKDCDVTAKQKGDLEKQIEGFIAVDMARQAHSFFLSLLHYFRDLHVIYHGGPVGFLVHRHLASRMFDSATSKEPLSLEKVEDAIRKACFAFERSTPLSFCIETLFLRLNLV